VEQKKEIYVPYNVLPLDAAGASQAIMQLDEVSFLRQRDNRYVAIQVSNDFLHIIFGRKCLTS
jgi:hypothetical protein